MDIIYSVAHQKTHEELRFSLRSLKNVEHNQVFIAGDIPKWTQNVVGLPKPQQGHHRGRDVLQNLLKIVNCSLVDEDILSMHDDFYILQPCSVGVYRGQRGSYSEWGAVSKKTMLVLKKLGCWGGYDYEQHLPFRCEKSKLKFVLDTIDKATDGEGGVYWRTVYGNYFKIGGEFHPDAKVNIRPTIRDDQLFLSSEDNSFGEHVKPVLEERFPEKSIYEK